MNETIWRLREAAKVWFAQDLEMDLERLIGGYLEAAHTIAHLSEQLRELPAQGVALVCSEGPAEGATKPGNASGDCSSQRV